MHIDNGALFLAILLAGFCLYLWLSTGSEKRKEAKAMADWHRQQEALRKTGKDE